VSDPHNLQRFIDAQDGVFDTALAELTAGAKRSHWMWFVFPQLTGLGRSSTAQYYGIASRDEARAYLAHPALGLRLRQCVEALLPWAGRRSPEQILGPIDALKLPPASLCSTRSKRTASSIAGSSLSTVANAMSRPSHF